MCILIGLLVASFLAFGDVSLVADTGKSKVSESPSKTLTLFDVRNDIDKMRQLIEDGADVNLARGKGETPLHDAARDGRGDIVALLISKGANVYAKDQDGFTPLHYAVMSSYIYLIGIARMLIAKGA